MLVYSKKKKYLKITNPDPTFPQKKTTLIKTSQCAKNNIEIPDAYSQTWLYQNRKKNHRHETWDSFQNYENVLETRVAASAPVMGAKRWLLAFRIFHDSGFFLSGDLPDGFPFRKRSFLSRFDHLAPAPFIPRPVWRRVGFTNVKMLNNARRTMGPNLRGLVLCALTAPTRDRHCLAKFYIFTQARS